VAIEVYGGSSCWARFCEHTNFGGRCVGPLRNGNGIKMPPGSEVRRKISSIEVGGDGRRRAGVTQEDLPEGFELYEAKEPSKKVYDPLCEAVYSGFGQSEFDMFSNSTVKHWAMETLLKNCEESFTGIDDVDRCKFYVYASTEIFDDKTIADTLKLDASEDHDMMTEYRHCGLLNGKIHSIIESGRVSGVSIVKKEGVEYFELDEPLTADSVDLVPNNGDVFSALVSAGSLLAMWIGTTMVKVCRDFDPLTGNYLL